VARAKLRQAVYRYCGRGLATTLVILEHHETAALIYIKVALLGKYRLFFDLISVVLGCVK
jgi:hypothetical protein